jgi:hypothetical protein
MIIRNYTRQIDWYDALDVTMRRDGKMPVNYFSFPSSLLNYAESLKSSYLMVIDDMYFRRLNMGLTLLAYYCSATKVVNTVVKLKAAGFKVKMFDQMYSDRAGVDWKKSDPYYISGPFNREEFLASHNAHQRKKLNKIIKTCDNSMRLVQPSQEAVMGLMDEWVQEAKTRHFMVVVGDSKRFIERFYRSSNNTYLHGVETNIAGELRAIIGYEVFDTPQGRYAQISMIKHATDIDFFSRYVWMTALEQVTKLGATVIHCGANSDVIKLQMGMKAIQSFRITI